MNEQKHKQIEFAPLKSKKITAVFDEPDVSSDGGLMLLREAMGRNNIVDRIAGSISDTRHESYVRHQMRELIAQRTGLIACGYEDANDCDTMCSDPLLKMLAERDPDADPLASQPTMTRLENEVTAKDLMRIGYAFIDNFIESFGKPPKMVVIDMDPTADYVHGKQQLAFFNAHEDEYCFMPFHVYDGLTGRLITTVLRTGKTPNAGEIKTILKRIEERLHKAWPQTTLLFRADSHHTKSEVMDWMESKGMQFVTGLSYNTRVRKVFADTIRSAEKRFEQWGRTVTMYADGFYAADTWSHPRRVVCRVIVSEQGTDIRFIVTSYAHASPKYLYANIYCGRGKMELMIKDHKTALKSDRTSCHRKEANQFRLFLHSAAYVLLHWMRENMLKGSQFARAQFDTIRLKLLKLGTRVENKKTLLRLHLPEACPYQQSFAKAMASLNTG